MAFPPVGRPRRRNCIRVPDRRARSPDCRQGQGAMTARAGVPFRGQACPSWPMAAARRTRRVSPAKSSATSSTQPSARNRASNPCDVPVRPGRSRLAANTLTGLIGGVLGLTVAGIDASRRVQVAGGRRRDGRGPRPVRRAARGRRAGDGTRRWTHPTGHTTGRRRCSGWPAKREHRCGNVLRST